MDILVAIDSIKDYENSIEIGNIFKEEIGENVSVMPFLDGGEGTVESMKGLLDGKYHYVNVHNPVNEIVTARYVMKDDYAVMEMAESSGLRLLYKEELNVMEASSLGLGEMLLDGLNANAKSFFIGIGDTATNDLGMGMLYALGARFYDENDYELNPVAKNLIKVMRIDIDNIDYRMFQSKVQIATSSDLTLFGENSFLESRIYRKGASIEDIAFLYNGCKHFKKKIEETLGLDPIDLPSLGSGGGVARALFCFFKAKVSRSMDIILETLNFPTLVENYDMLILGENVDQFDATSSLNVSKFARRYNDDIKIMFLEDDDGKNIEQRDIFDIIYKYKIEDNLNRNERNNAIRDLAKRLKEDYFGEH